MYSDDFFDVENESTSNFKIGKHKGQRYKATVTDYDEANEYLAAVYCFVEGNISYVFSVQAANKKLFNAAEEMISSFTLLDDGASSDKKSQTEHRTV